MQSLRNLRHFRQISALFGSNHIQKQYLCTAKESNDRTTHFGFQTVGENEKADKGLT